MANYSTIDKIKNRLAVEGLGDSAHPQYNAAQIGQAMDDATSAINDCIREVYPELSGNVSNTNETPILCKIEIDLVYMFFQQSRNARNREVSDNVTSFWMQTPELTPSHVKILHKVAKRLRSSVAFNYNMEWGLYND